MRLQVLLVLVWTANGFTVPGARRLYLRRKEEQGDVVRKSQRVKEESVRSQDLVPSFGQLARFTVTAVPIFIAPTLLSLIDTAVVGRVSSLELAAMGPACAVVDSISGLLVFISVGTTNAISRALASEKKGISEARRRCSVSLVLATAVGIFSGILLFIVGLKPIWFEQFAFTTAPLHEANEMARAAAAYVAIRALAMPAATALMAAQAACLGAKDSKSPALATALASFVNIIGDIFLVLGPPRLGIIGAAWATVACQYAAFFTCAAALRPLRLLDVRDMLTKPPLIHEIKRFFAFGGFLIVVLMKLVTYNQAVYLAALLGPASSAAHQVMYSLSRFCFSLGDVTGASAQSFLPPILKQTKSISTSEQSAHYRTLVIRVILMSLSVATMVSTVTLALPFLFAGIFTTDSIVIQLMRQAAPWAALGLLFHPVVVGLEGCLLAKGDVNWLVSNYIITGGLSVIAVAALAALGNRLSIIHLWQYLAAYQFTRFISFIWRTLYYKKKNKEACKMQQQY